MDLVEGMTLMAQLAQDSRTTSEERQTLNELIEKSAAFRKRPDQIVNVEDGELPVFLVNETQVSPPVLGTWRISERN